MSGSFAAGKRDCKIWGKGKVSDPSAKEGERGHKKRDLASPWEHTYYVCEKSGAKKAYMCEEREGR